TESGSQSLTSGDLVYVPTHAGDPTENGNPGGIYLYKGPNQTLDLGNLGSNDFSNSGLWQQQLNTDTGWINDIAPELGNLTDSNARAVGGDIVYNEVVGSAQSNVYSGITLKANAGDINVTATEGAQYYAEVTSNISSSGGSTFGGGTVFAANGQAATNVLQTHATALVQSATLTASGNVDVEATNSAIMDARVHAAAQTPGGGTQQAASFSLAFNTVRWTPVNIHSQTIDALLQDPNVSVTADYSSLGGPISNLQDGKKVDFNGTIYSYQGTPGTVDP